MGSYLSEPVTEKISTDEANDKLNCGASSMQGWRVTQEDAHNNILDFDTNTSFFAVYDGHGGHEVAQYCSQKLPQFIKDTQAYKDGDIERALIDGFLGFDATIATPEVIQILKEIVGEREAEEASDEEENVDNLYKEATMPIEQVIEKYTNLVTPGLKNLKKDAEKFPKSPYLKSKQDDGCSASSSNSNLPQPGSSQAESSSISDSSEAKPSVETKETSLLEKNGTVMDVKVSSTDNTESKEVTTSSGKEENDNTVTPIQNGETTETGIKIDVTSPSPQENGDIDKKDDSSEDDDEGVNTAIEVEGSDEEGTSSEGGDEAEEEEEEDEGDEDQDEDLEFTKNMKEEPGSDSGCTAVVALLKGNELYVANAGDSRCIVCRNGKAIDMSFDHKPEDAPERERIVKAGGRVTADGRVNGGLNLSRAIGDHAYKQSKELSDKEQMITALPDIKTLTINPGEDEFFVLACDGIWNFMSSQEVVDFVRPMILENKKKLSTICEEMFDHCLAPNTLGDGTGCDNMTAIIVQFKTNIMKRSASPRADNDNSKRAKTEETIRSDTANTA
ncbi:probable protein phosphatase CG10417 isoform X3 [Diorhabda carinulata]|uniref:probable protein phosphatase CG10417 isoform X3 n=1 Tax=Diorhabda carinulata TaxID=1163345 RepID=UPI0025A04A06|nr:probable protein phosphatase CG10417 isoform X3 [Diorhabda carinulata]